MHSKCSKKNPTRLLNSKGDVGYSPDLELKIHTTDDKPVQKTYNSIPKLLYNEVKEHVLDRGPENWRQRILPQWFAGTERPKPAPVCRLT